MANSAFSDATHSFNSHNNVNVTSVATDDILKFDGTNWINTTMSHTTIDVTQSSHGFSVGEALKSSGSNGSYAKAQADTAGNAEVVGIVTAVADTNNFTLTFNGMITVAGAVPNESAGTALFLSASTAGALTATEPSTAGQISKPVAIVTTANAEMVLFSYRGETISTGVTNWDVNGLELVLDADGDTTLHASSDDQIDVKISGADDFRFTANKLDILSGSTLEVNGTLDLNGSEFILDADADTSITSDTDDQIDVKIAGADDFRFTANNFNVLSGSTLTVDSGATITNSGTANGFGGGGKILQAVTAVFTGIQTISTGDDSLTDITNLTVTITPATSSSKFLVLACIGKMDVNTNNNTSQFAVLRTPSGGSTSRLNTGTSTSNRIAMSFTAGTGQSNGRGGLHFSALDSPSTTSAITYKVAASCHDSPSHPLYINRWRSDSDNGDGPSARTASSITVLEVGA